MATILGEEWESLPEGGGIDLERILFSEMMDGFAIDEVVRDENFSMPVRHFHDTYELYFLLEGERYYFIEKETYHVRKGDVVLINRQQIHKTSQAGSLTHDRILLQIDGRKLEACLKQMGLFSVDELFSDYCGVMRLSEEAQEEVKNLLFAVRGEMAKKQERYDVMVRLKLCQLLLVLYRCRRTGIYYEEPRTVQTAKHQKVHEVAEYLTSHCESEEGLAELAARFYISKSYLSRIFKEVTGYTVNEYRSVARVKRAEKLLSGSSYSVTDIAGRLGFESITYFERVFKKYTGMTPMQFKKDH